MKKCAIPIFLIISLPCRNFWRPLGKLWNKAFVTLCQTSISIGGTQKNRYHSKTLPFKFSTLQNATFQMCYTKKTLTSKIITHQIRYLSGICYHSKFCFQWDLHPSQTGLTVEYGSQLYGNFNEKNYQLWAQYIEKL